MAILRFESWTSLINLNNFTAWKLLLYKPILWKIYSKQTLEKILKKPGMNFTPWIKGAVNDKYSVFFIK